MLKLFICLFGLLFITSTLANNLSLTLPKNLPEDAVKNIKAYLGDLPTDSPSRIAYVFSAKNNAVKALQALGYYRSVVNMNLNKNNGDTFWDLKLDITLNELTVVNSINIIIKGDAEKDVMFDKTKINVPIKPNDPLHHGYYEEIKSNLLTLGLQRGYFDGYLDIAKIAISPNNVADITISYSSGTRYKFGKISFINNTVKYNFVDKIIPFSEGDDYQVAKLQKFQNNLEKTQYFKNIVIVPNKDPETLSTNKSIPIQVTLERAKKHYFNVGVGFATDTDFRLSTGWKTPLLNKYGHRQETQIQYSKINPTGRFNYSIPLNGSLNDTVQFRLLLENDQYGDIESNYWSSKISKVKSNDNSNSEYYIRYLHEEWDIDVTENISNTLLLGYSWSTTKRKGSVIDPSEGFSQYYNVEGSHKDISSEISFLKLHGHWRYIKTLKPKHRIVTRAEIGYSLVKNDDVEVLSPSLRFFAGGDQSIRGFAYQSIGPTRSQRNMDGTLNQLVVGGNRLVVASVEYQYYFTPTVRAAVFADIGSSFDTGFERSYSVGPGVHYISPIGAIKLDLGYSLSEDSPSWRIHLNLGAEL